MTWTNGRPIYDRLPGQSEAYRKEDGTNPNDPPVADWLTGAWDKLLMDSKLSVDKIPNDMLSPTTAKTQYLDWLAQLCGYTGEYWDTSWSDVIKRQLIERSLSFVWEYKGTKLLLEWLFTLFALDASIYQVGDFLAGISVVGDAVGSSEDFEYYIVVGLKYLRTSTEWALLERLNRLYSPIYAESSICYDGFYAGFSLVGDPIL